MIPLATLGLLLVAGLLGWLVWYLREQKQPARLDKLQLERLVAELHELADGWAGTDRGLAKAVTDKIDAARSRT